MLLFIGYVIVMFVLLLEIVFIPIVMYADNTTYLGKWFLYVHDSVGGECRIRMLIEKTEGSAMDYSNIKVDFKPKHCKIEVVLCDIHKYDMELVNIENLSVRFSNYLFLAGLQYNSRGNRDSTLIKLYLTDVFMKIDTFCIKIKYLSNVL